MKKEEKNIIRFNIGKLQCYLFNAGSFRSDGGAAMGVLPKYLWEKQVTPDAKNRIEFATNLLLIKDPHFNLLIDTGIGYEPEEKIRRIYKPEPCSLLENLEKCGCSRYDIDYVVLTHLHYDHIGGLLYKQDNRDTLMFPEAKHIIQKSEWEMAMAPDKLNQAAYRFNKPLKLLKKCNLKIIDDDYELSPEITLFLCGGHSVGSQAIRIQSGKELCFYPGDLIPHEIHLHLPVTAAYDISRSQTFQAKKKIIDELIAKKGYLIFNHQPDKKIIKNQSIPDYS